MTLRVDRTFYSWPFVWRPKSVKFRSLLTMPPWRRRPRRFCAKRNHKFGPHSIEMCFHIFGCTKHSCRTCWPRDAVTLCRCRPCPAWSAWPIWFRSVPASMRYVAWWRLWIKKFVPTIWQRWGKKTIKHKPHINHIYFHCCAQIETTTVYPFMVSKGLLAAGKGSIRFPSLLGVVSPKEAAANVIDAHRRNVKECTIPGYLFSLNNIFR